MRGAASFWEILESMLGGTNKLCAVTHLEACLARCLLRSWGLNKTCWMYLVIYVDIWLELGEWLVSREGNCWKVLAWKKS